MTTTSRLALGLFLTLLPLTVFAHPWDVGPELLAQDTRFTAVRDTDTNFAPIRFASRDAWEPFAESLRLRILVSSGLWPEPERTPLNTRVFDTIKRDGYSVSKVRFEASPGFLVTGNLYVPAGKGPFPAVLNPHGHWKTGRLENTHDASIPGRCITFARMGMVAFSVDMIGYNDSRQFSFPWGHRPGEVPQATRRAEELWGIHAFALQLWGNIRALDFLQSLPEVDPARLACTGASGGGTQTFALTAVDPRVQVAAPVNMISHTMQGGCQCENAPLLRIGASNMEVGALFAPRPMMMISATGDWTKETPQVEYPAIREVYALFGAPDHVANVHVDAGHNYNKISREAVYRFFGKWFLNAGDEYADFTEPAFTVESNDALRLFPGEGPLPDHAKQDEVVASLIAERRERIAKTVQERGKDPAFVQQYRSAVRFMVGGDFAQTRQAHADRLSSEKKEGYTLERWALRAADTGAVVPAILLVPDARVVGSATLIVHPEGKSQFATADGSVVDALREYSAGDARVVALVDPFRTGESAVLERRLGAFPDTFVPTDTAYRVQDLAMTIAWLSERAGNAPVKIAAEGPAQVWAVLAASLSRNAVSTEADPSNFPQTDAAWVANHYLPCLQSLGGITTVAAVLAPDRVKIAPGAGGLPFALE
jgi:hypothetical protein